MIFWQVGGAVAIVRYVFKDPAMDLRFVMLGALLPNLIDKPIGSVLFNEALGSSRVYGHTLVVPALLLVLVMLFTKRGTARRKAWLGLPIGWLLHVFLDGQWAAPEGFWWPFLGLDFPPMEDSTLWGVIESHFTSVVAVATEVVGLAYLVVLYRRGGLGQPEARHTFLTKGTIALPLPR